ncbi:hypothetical protein K1X76_08265 [bacterium]|nr:hypothetical protein [bacterium]
MRQTLLGLIFLVVSSSVWAEGPVEKVACDPAKDDSGYHLEFKLSKDYEYGSLTIKRTGDGKKEANYMKDLSAFKGGMYVLDVAAKGNVSGYALENKENGSSFLKRTEATITCGKLPVAKTPASSKPNSKSKAEVTPPANAKPAPTQAKNSPPHDDNFEIKDF